MRAAVIAYLGDVCSRCGFRDPRALQIDHIYGGGRAQQRAGINGIKFYKHVLENLREDRPQYQLLCANCNWIKRHENNELASKNLPANHWGFSLYL